MGVTIKEIGEMPDLGRIAALLGNTRVLVGIPEGSGHDGEMTSAALMFIHSNGSPVHGIPARPVIEPAIDQAKDRIAEYLKEAAEAAAEGNEGGVLAALEKAGLYAEGQVKDYFTSGGLAPNAPITISGGWMRNKKSGKVFKVEGKGSNGPLIDTGQLRQSITHVIERK